jgi:RPA family protein
MLYRDQEHVLAISVQKMQVSHIKEQELQLQQQKGAMQKADKAKKGAEAKKSAKLQILEPDESTAAAATSSVAFVTPTSED